MFLLNLPLIALALVALQRVPETTGRAAGRSRSTRSARCSRCLGLGGVIYGLTDGAQARLDRARASLDRAHGRSGALALIALVPAELRATRRRCCACRCSSRQFDAINAVTLGCSTAR